MKSRVRAESCPRSRIVNFKPLLRARAANIGAGMICSASVGGEEVVVVDEEAGVGDGASNHVVWLR